MTDPKWWDATFPKDRCNFNKLIEIANAQCERYAIGDEVGEGGYEHYQARFVFKVGKELATIRNQFAPACDCGHWSKTHVRDFEYVKKDGKFYCSWEGALRKFGMLDLLPWQAQAEQFYRNESDREIYVVWDEDGSKGKSWFSKYMEATHQADVCPVTDGDASNYIEYCLNHPAKGYIFDVPRADTIKTKKAMWRAIEQIKNGLLYDRRYTSRKMWIDPPKILVFTNELPEFTVLSRDRWRVHAIARDILCPVDIDTGAILCF